MLLSVIIPTCNRNGLLGICLDKLAPTLQTIGLEKYEVIVTDDGTNNAAKTFLEHEYPWVKWVDGPQRGPAANRNNGAKHANGDWLVFIDDDCEPDKLLLEKYYAAIVNYPNSKAFEGAILPDNWDLLKKDMAECPINTEGNCFWSANICIENELFKSIGGFDEAFIIAAQEDQDIYLRLKELTVVTFIKDSIVIHPVRIVFLSKKIKGLKAAFKNYYFFISKHYPEKTKKMLYSGLYVHSKLIIKFLLERKYKKSVYHIFSLFENLFFIINS